MRGSGVSFIGGSLVFDSETFTPKPGKAITIALWVKLVDLAGKHTLFCTIGQSGQNGYRLQVIDGKIKWYLQREFGNVFHLETGPVVLRKRWFQITVTADIDSNEAKIYANGGIQSIGVAHGDLPRDWSVKAGFGVHEDGKSLYGMMDDLYIYSRALSKEEVLNYMHQFEDMKILMTPPPMTPTHPPTKIITTPHHTTRVRTFTPKRKSTRHHTTPIPHSTRPHGSTHGHPTTIKRKKTKSTKTTTPVTTTTAQTTPTTSTKNLTTKPLPVMDIKCKYGNVYEFTDLKGGLAAGNFIDRGITNSIQTCMELCCAHRTCDLAYVISARCYLVECYTVDLCSIVPKGVGSLSPIIGMVIRPNGPKSK